MNRIDGRPILTAAQMRAAEDAAMADGASVDILMERAGRAVAGAVRRLAGANGILILCGPGNNGGDGYVAARVLREAGLSVRVAASAPPTTDSARRARAGWGDRIEPIETASRGSILVDALFGTGLTRPLEPALGAALASLAAVAHLTIAVDVPSGIASDDGAMLSPVPRFDLTLALGAAKPAHLLQPAARWCGHVRVLDIGVPVGGDVRVIERPKLPRPGPDAHKYSRGMVACVAGSMAGATELAALSAMRAGAGYVLLLGGAEDGEPHAIVRKPYVKDALGEARVGAVLIGPGLGRDDAARARLQDALECPHPLVIDGDALHLIDLPTLAKRSGAAILTPHAGEFDALFGKGAGSKIDRARDAAARANAVVVFKGADTVVAAADGRVCIAGDASDWLSTAGTGDVLAGAIAAMLAAKVDPFEAASAGVWLHGEAARRLGGAFIADDLAHALTAVRAAI